MVLTSLLTFSTQLKPHTAQKEMGGKIKVIVSQNVGLCCFMPSQCSANMFYIVLVLDRNEKIFKLALRSKNM